MPQILAPIKAMNPPNHNLENFFKLCLAEISGLQSRVFKIITMYRVQHTRKCSILRLLSTFSRQIKNTTRAGIKSDRTACC